MKSSKEERSQIHESCIHGSDKVLQDSEQFSLGLRVMIVDDDLICLMVLEKMLRQCAYRVSKYSRAETALSVLRNNKGEYDMVMSDLHMPGMDGLQLLQHIKTEMDLPVIMVSSDDEEKVMSRSKKLGASDYLVKPVTIETLRGISNHVTAFRKAAPALPK